MAVLAAEPEVVDGAEPRSTWTTTTVSSPTTQPSWPGSTTAKAGASKRSLQPSAYSISMEPWATKLTWACWHQSVPLIGCMWVRHRQPGG